MHVLPWECCARGFVQLVFPLNMVCYQKQITSGLILAALFLPHAFIPIFSNKPIRLYLGG